jgi:hypothetical protein
MPTNSLQLLGIVSGWTILGLGAVQVALPWVARSRPLFQNHYGIGLMIVAVSFIHAAVAISGFTLDGLAAAVGVAVATAGLLLAVGQVSAGWRLRSMPSRARGRLRRLHLAGAILLTMVALAHVVLNGGFVNM